MTRLSRFGLWALVSACLASAASAVEVTAEVHVVHHIWRGTDPYGDSGYYVSAEATVVPSAPRGVGDLQPDVRGELIRGSLSLEPFSIDGYAIPAWGADLQLGLPTPATGWPIPDYCEGIGADLFLSRFASQSDFSGTLRLSCPWGDNYTYVEIAFAAGSGGVVECPGETLFLDDDGDGEVNGRDASSGSMDTQFGNAVDSDGRTVVEFCSAGQASRPNRLCERLDYRNDEPLRRRPADCQLLPDTSCRPAEFFSSQPQAPVSPRTCLGHAVVDDADADGEPDGTDHCPNTPSGSAIDGDGCSAQQFCSQQSVQICRRADFGNDEPYLKKPGDCARTKSKPRACTAAAAN